MHFRNHAANFVELCSIYANQLVIKVALSIINSDELRRSNDDQYLSVTFMDTGSVYVTRRKFLTCVSASEVKLTVCVRYLSATYLQFQFLLIVCFYSMAERELLCVFCIVTCVKEGTSQPLCTKALPNHADSECVLSVRVNRAEAEFIGNKQTDARLYTGTSVTEQNSFSG